MSGFFPPITNVSGIYGPQTEAAVRMFQTIRELGNASPNGIVDRSTWFRMSYIYSAVKRLGELVSEGIILGITRNPPTETIREGARGRLVQQAQYILNFISEFFPAIPTVLQNSSFDSTTANAVSEFQRNFGLTPDGIMGSLTWRRLYEVYWNIRDNGNLPPGGGEGEIVPPLPPTNPGEIPQFPGQIIRVGSRGEDVRRVQRCLNSLRSKFPSIGQLNEDGADVII